MEAGEFRLSSFAHGSSQGWIRMIGEIKERSGLAVFFTHEQKWDIRREQDNGCRQFLSLETDQAAASFSQSAVSDLVVILRKHDKL
jgi:hypothetical protein